MRMLIAFLVVLLVSGRALAFSPEECSALLQFGVYDTHDVVSTKEKYSAFQAQYCKSSKGSFTVSVPSLPVAGSGNNESAMCNGSASEQYERYFFYSAEKTINSNLVAGFDECLKADREGLSYRVKTGADPRYFFLDLSFDAPKAVPVETVGLLVEGATCNSAAFDATVEDGKRSVFTMTDGKAQLSCTRLPDATVRITASAEKTSLSSEAIALPAYSKPLAPNLTFYSPLVPDPQNPQKAEALDLCAGPATSCEAGGIAGKPSADLWCHALGMADAVSVDVIQDAPPTRLMSGLYCSGAGCDRISRITCSPR